MMNSIRIHFRNLQDATSETQVPYSHIHGFLGIEIGGRLVPYLGYEGKDDVCFNDWIENLITLRNIVDGEIDDQYVFDEYEEGQPAFQFDIEDGEAGKVIRLSIVETDIGEGFDDPDWQGIAFSYDDFLLALANFRHHFMEWIGQRASESYSIWLDIWE